MAFALNQIFAVVRPVGESEPMLNYHDIFVRNAFGNWKDLLREVAYSPIMAMNLSFLNSKSMAYVKATQNQLSFADENFAREVSIYQLLCSLPSKSYLTYTYIVLSIQTTPFLTGAATFQLRHCFTQRG